MAKRDDPPNHTGPTVADAAAQALVGRLDLVDQSLRAIVAADADPVVSVHRLRVSTRRAAAALLLYRRQLSRSLRRDLREVLRDIRHAAGTLRDLDVFVAGHSEGQYLLPEEILGPLREQREPESQALIAWVAELLERRTVAELTAAAQHWIANRGGKRLCKPSGCWAARKLKRVSRDLSRAFSQLVADPRSLHSLRIEVKRTRYSAELLLAAAGRKNSPVLESLVALQDELGVINDHQVACQHIEELLNHYEPDSLSAASLERVAELHLHTAHEAMDAFVERWTRDLRKKLRNRLRGLLDPEPQAAQMST